MTMLTGTDLLDHLVAKMDEDGIRCAVPEDRAEQVAVRDMLAAAAVNLRAGQVGPLEMAVLAFARMCAAYFTEETL